MAGVAADPTRLKTKIQNIEYRTTEFRRIESLRSVILKGNKNIRDYFQFGEVAGYFFRKKDPNQKPNFNLRMMHSINKLSILMFLIGIIYLIGKYLF